MEQTFSTTKISGLSLAERKLIQFARVLSAAQQTLRFDQLQEISDITDLNIPEITTLMDDAAQVMHEAKSTLS